VTTILMSGGIREESYVKCEANLYQVVDRERELRREISQILVEEKDEDIEPSEADVRADLTRILLNGDKEESLDVIKVANGDVRDPEILYLEILGEQ